MKKKMTRLVSLLLSLVLMCMCFTACGTGGGNGEKTNGEVNEEGEVKIMWWTSYATANQVYLNKIIDQFNKDFDGQYNAELVYTGANANIRTKISTTKQDLLPALIDGQPIVLEYYGASDAIVPIQDFIDADEEDWTANVYDSVKSAYTAKAGKLVGWPLGVSSSGWFVNVDMLKEAGYSVEDLTSYVKIAEVASALVSKKVADYGIAYFHDGTEVFNALTLEGCEMVDGENGYAGDVTKGLLNEGSTKEALNTFLKSFAKVCDDGAMYTFGADANSDTLPAFAQEKIGIVAATNSYANKIIAFQPKFEWTFVPFTSVTDQGKYTGNALIQGHGVFIVNNVSKKVQQGAYELVKYLAKPENQAYWASNTGYIPYTQEAFEESVYQDWMTKNFPSSQKLQQVLVNTPKELRPPAVVLPEALTGACYKMLSNIAVNDDRDFNKVIEEQNDFIDECIEIESLRKK